MYDHSRVVRLLSKAVDELRREEWWRLGDAAVGSGTKHVRDALLHRPWNVTPEQQQTLATLHRSNDRIVVAR